MRKMPKNFDYLIGKRFGKLTVVEIIKSHKSPSKARCVCDCGGERTTIIYLLTRGDVKSCGCLFRKHGEHGTRLYWIWRDIIKRCYNPNCKCYKWYGGKGITVCDKWRNEYISFRDWALLNGYADGLTIDRINPDDNYHPLNCQWITQSENTAKMQRQKKQKAELKKKYTEGTE